MTLKSSGCWDHAAVLGALRVVQDPLLHLGHPGKYRGRDAVFRRSREQKSDGRWGCGISWYI